MNKPRCWLFLLMLSASGAYAQDADSISNRVNSVTSPQKDDEMTSADSLSIFTLIDSLLSLAESETSQFAIRLSYNSNVLSAGRTLGIENFGLAPGVSYYHKSGFYADLTGYWSKDFDPAYYLTVFSLGYMKDFSKRFSVMAGYDRYFYSIGEDYYIPYKNTFSVTPILEFKPVSLTANYSYYFGDEIAHRIMPGISITLQKKKWKKIDRIALTPSFYLLAGDQIITTVDYVLPASPLQQRINTAKQGIPEDIVITSKSVFGIMNYAVSIPLSVTYRHWGFTFTYAYSVPKALPGETLTYSESTYLSSSLTYFIDTGGRKNSL